MDVICGIYSRDGCFGPDSNGENEENMLLSEMKESVIVSRILPEKNAKFL